MIIQLPPDFAERLAPELARAGRREIGGVLVGEHIAEETFRLADFSVQRSGGAVACFVRHPAKHRRFLARFFARTGTDFERFNYLGEWHSHPSFEACPSGTDLAQMQAIVEDGEQAPHFAILIIARLAFEGRIELSALAFTPFALPTPVDVHFVDRPANDPAAPVRQGSAIGTVVDSVLYWFRRVPAPGGIG
ncbi:Mov34/MPN/PAD-1 family protein [Sphingobium limneticum]|uniref:Mov34/MPN/PAD-1 family protein n=1 Tax=Sphingobium limneticum TaxID=1007511 RepID=UPI003D0242E6